MQLISKAKDGVTGFWNCHILKWRYCTITNTTSVLEAFIVFSINFIHSSLYFRIFTWELFEWQEKPYRYCAKTRAMLKIGFELLWRIFYKGFVKGKSRSSFTAGIWNLRGVKSLFLTRIGEIHLAPLKRSSPFPNAERQKADFFKRIQSGFPFIWRNVVLKTATLWLYYLRKICRLVFFNDFIRLDLATLSVRKLRNWVLTDLWGRRKRKVFEFFSFLFRWKKLFKRKHVSIFCYLKFWKLLNLLQRFLKVNQMANQRSRSNSLTNLSFLQNCDNRT